MGFVFVPLSPYTCWPQAPLPHAGGPAYIYSQRTIRICVVTSLIPIQFRQPPLRTPGSNATDQLPSVSSCPVCPAAQCVQLPSASSARPAQCAQRSSIAWRRWSRAGPAGSSAKGRAPAPPSAPGQSRADAGDGDGDGPLTPLQPSVHMCIYVYGGDRGRARHAVLRDEVVWDSAVVFVVFLN